MKNNTWDHPLSSTHVHIHAHEHTRTGAHGGTHVNNKTEFVQHLQNLELLIVGTKCKPRSYWCTQMH